MKKALTPEDWGLNTGINGELMIGNISTVELAKEFDTPLYVLNTDRLKETSLRFQSEVKKAYIGKTFIHYPFKCNSTPAVLEVLKESGLNAEVMTDFELELALEIGFKPNQIIVNGPCKTDKFLSDCIEREVKLLIVDSLDELEAINKILNEKNKTLKILLRVNPDYIPQNMNSGTATGSRKGSSFGLDLLGGEVHKALDIIKASPRIFFDGFHFHIGTGIRNPKDYSKALNKLKPLIADTASQGFKINTMDVGGGFASFTTRELTTFEMLLYQSLNHYPSKFMLKEEYSFYDFALEISNKLFEMFPPFELPDLIYEPGRSIVSQNQFLLLKVHRIKARNGEGKWLITDGGLGTITLPTFYEYHEVFLCNDVKRPKEEHVNITGPCCFAADIVYKNKLMPKIERGEILALMDTGAYFNAMESNFGFPRPAIVSVTNNKAELVRLRENFSTMVFRDKEFENLREEYIK